jgi:hypothetical protein
MCRHCLTEIQGFAQCVAICCDRHYNPPFLFDLVYLPKNGAPYILSLRDSLISLLPHLKILLITHVLFGKKKSINTWC